MLSAANRNILDQSVLFLNNSGFILQFREIGLIIT